MDAITFTDPVQRTPSKPSMDGDDDNSFAGQLVRDGINGVNETAVGNAHTPALLKMLQVRRLLVQQCVNGRFSAQFADAACAYKDME